VPLLTVIAGKASIPESMLASYIAGVIFFGGTCYWITETMYIYGGLPPVTAVGGGALFAFVHGFFFVLFGLALHLAVIKFGRRGIFFAAPLWVTVEFLRSILFSGFPWMLSGYALAPYSGVLQLVSWTGVYGLSFVATALCSVIAFGI